MGLTNHFDNFSPVQAVTFQRALAGITLQPSTKALPYRSIPGGFSERPSWKLWAVQLEQKFGLNGAQMPGQSAV